MLSPARSRAEQEQALLEAYRRDPSDPGVLEGLYAFAPKIREVCGRRLPTPQDAEDACHDTMLAAWHSLHHFREGSPLWPWLRAIAERTCADFWRRSHRTAPLDALPERVRPSTPSPEHAVEEREVRDLIRDGVAQIDVRDRKYLYRREVEGWSYAELAEHEQRTESAVRGLVTRARHRLRRRVEVLAARRGLKPLAGIPLMAFLRARSRWAARRAALLQSRGEADGGLFAQILPHLPAVLANGSVAIVASIGLAIGAGGGASVAGAPLAATHDSKATELADIPKPSTGFSAEAGSASVDAEQPAPANEAEAPVQAHMHNPLTEPAREQRREDGTSYMYDVASADVYTDPDSEPLASVEVSVGMGCVDESHRNIFSRLMCPMFEAAT